MRIVQIRRIGDNNVVPIPKEFEARGYVPGSLVIVEELPRGELRILPPDQTKERVRDVGRHIVAEHGEALADPRGPCP